MSMQQGGRKKGHHRTQVSRVEEGNEKAQRDSQWTWVPSIVSSRQKGQLNLVNFEDLHFPGMIRALDSDSFSWNSGTTKANPRMTIYWQGKIQVLCWLGVHNESMTHMAPCTQCSWDASSWLESTDQVHRALGAKSLSSVCSFPSVKQFEIRNARWSWTLTDRALNEQLNVQWYL